MMHSEKNSKSFNLIRPWETLDPWQERYINQTGDCLVVTGRQVGKTAAAAIKIVKYLQKPNTIILIGALTEKQAQNLFFKALFIAQEMYPKKVVTTAREKPTKNKFEFYHKEGNSKVLCHALGFTGEGIRGYTVNHLFIDECKEIAEQVFVAIEPMISVTKGTRDYLGTPGGKVGHFWKCSNDPDFKVFNVSAYDCPRHTKESLEKYRSRMSQKEFAQEYLGQFLDDVMRIYTEDWIKKVCVEEEENTKSESKYYGGVDIARFGDNKSSFSIGREIQNKIYKQVRLENTEHQLTTETTKKIVELDNAYKCKKWGIDGAGVGGGVVDQLKDTTVKHRFEDLQNAKKTSDLERKKGKTLLKEDMYVNLVWMGEAGKITLLKKDELIRSLANAYFEYDENGKIRIFGDNNDEREATVRMAWVMNEDKSLNLWADWR